jgi:hypothetical protein
MSNTMGIAVCVGPVDLHALCIPYPCQFRIRCRPDNATRIYMRANGTTEQWVLCPRPDGTIHPGIRQATNRTYRASFVRLMRWRASNGMLSALPCVPDKRLRITE